MATFLAWLVFTAAAFLILIYMAAMAAGSELTPWKTAREYVRARPITLTVRFVLVQFLFFGIWDQPALVGDLFGKAAGVGPIPLPTRWWLAGLLGLASDKLADLAMSAGGWLYRRSKSLFANGNGKPASP